MIEGNEFNILLDVVIASVLTLLIGLEREKAHKAAGMRTNMIVGGFTCLIILLSVPLIQKIAENAQVDMVEADPIRIIQAIVIGISFIGAGTILKQKEHSDVKGLTTAATLLFSSGIGICVALHYYVLAALLTFFIILINFLLRLILKKFTTLK